MLGSDAFRSAAKFWDEQRLQLWAARNALSDGLVGRHIDAELARLMGPTALQPLVRPGDGFVEVSKEQWNMRFSLTGGLSIALDPNTGALTSFKMEHGKDWASPLQPLSRFVYVTHSGAQGEAFLHNYSYDSKPAGWAPEAFAKPGLTSRQANASVSTGSISKMWKKIAGKKTEADAVVVELSIDAKLNEQYGAPRTVYLMYERSRKGLDVTLRWLNKTTTRLPESIWLEWRPQLPAGGQQRKILTTKLGTVIDLANVVANGTWLHGADLDRGVRFSDLADELEVIGIDAPFVAVGQPGLDLNLLEYPMRVPDESAKRTRGSERWCRLMPLQQSLGRQLCGLVSVAQRDRCAGRWRNDLSMGAAGTEYLECQSVFARLISP